MKYLDALMDALKKKHHHYETRLDMAEQTDNDYIHVFGQTLYYKGQIEILEHLQSVIPDSQPETINQEN